MSDQTFTIEGYPETLAMVRLGPGAEIPSWAESGTLFAVSATHAETSLVCAARRVPRKVPTIGPLVAFAVQGPLDPETVGVLHGLLGPLTEAGVSVFTHATFDTDWILVPLEQADVAVEAWRRRGHTVVPVTFDPPPSPAQEHP